MLKAILLSYIPSHSASISPPRSSRRPPLLLLRYVTTLPPSLGSFTLRVFMPYVFLLVPSPPPPPPRASAPSSPSSSSFLFSSCDSSLVRSRRKRLIGSIPVKPIFLTLPPSLPPSLLLSPPHQIQNRACLHGCWWWVEAMVRYGSGIQLLGPWRRRAWEDRPGREGGREGGKEGGIEGVGREGSRIVEAAHAYFYLDFLSFLRFLNPANVEMWSTSRSSLPPPRPPPPPPPPPPPRFDSSLWEKKEWSVCGV